MPGDDAIERQLRRYALHRFRTFGQLPLRDLGTPLDSFYRLPEPLLDFMVTYREPVLHWLEATLQGAGDEAGGLEFMAGEMVRFVEAKNQFVSVEAPEHEALLAVYRRFLAGFRDALRHSDRVPRLAAELAEMLAAHHAGLERFTTDLLAGSVGPASTLVEPACGLYSPAFQLAVLGVELGDLPEPILDLGCGQRGELVAYLRARGKAAFGVDRSAAEREGLIRADWLSYGLGRGAWGAVLSHMALTNHFLHHHLRRGGQPERYARRYLKVLDALKPGGRFIYAPGVPFFEELLPRGRYQIERRPVPALLGTPADLALRERLGVSVLYACHVTRSGGG